MTPDGRATYSLRWRRCPAHLRRLETLTLRGDRERDHFAIADDGVGMAEAPSWDGEGLIGMRDRIGSVAGELEIVSSPGAGTTVRGSAPLSESAHEEAQ